MKLQLHQTLFQQDWYEERNMNSSTENIYKQDRIVYYAVDATFRSTKSCPEAGRIRGMWTATVVRSNRGAPKWGGCRAAVPPNSQKPKFKETQTLWILHQKIYVISPSDKISHWNRLMTSTLEFWKNKKIGHCDWVHGSCSYIYMYISAVANSVMLYLRHDFYNIIFKIKYKLYIVSGSVPPPPLKKFWVRTCV
jgi:hypothetical protein